MIDTRAPLNAAPARPPAPEPTGGRALLERLAALLIPATNPAGGVYGLLAIGALLAAESGRHESYLDTVLSALIAACLYWLLHSYATILGRRLTTGERLRPSVLLRGFVHDWALLRGASIPFAALLVAWVSGASQRTAVTVALWCSVLGLVGLEVLAGLRARARLPELALETAIGLTMGLAVLALRIVLH